MWPPEVLAVIAATFLLAGLVKGVVGLGLPTVALALLTAALGLKEAMALMVIPAIATNVWQGLTGGAFIIILRRFWTLLAAACIGTWFGAGILARADAGLLSGLLGILLCVYSGMSIAAPQIPPPGRLERSLSPLFGAASGFVTGLTGSFVVPGVLYLQALGLPRDILVQTMGVAFTVSMVTLAAALARHDLLSADLGLLSAAAVVPALLGMVLGGQVRRRLPEQRFRQVLFAALLLLGMYIAGRAFL
jgi:uncharacterized membrane protein YfcA